MSGIKISGRKLVAPQITFRLTKAATVEYFPDPDVESEWLVFRTKTGRPTLYMLAADYDKFFPKK